MTKTNTTTPPAGRSSAGAPVGDRSTAQVQAGGPGRILLVCFRFGPGCDTGGYRWNAMVRDMVRLGWRFDVITVGNLVIEGGTGHIDRRLHGGAVEIFQVSPQWWGQKLRDGYRRRLRHATRTTPTDADARAHGNTARAGAMQRLWSRLRRDGIAVTELMRDLNWARRARRARRLARGLAGQRRYRCVVVSSPRHLTHMVGADLARRFHLPYVPDFRDPWFYGRGVDRARLDPLTRAVWRHCERRCMRVARFAIDISEGAQRAVRAELDAHIPLPRYFIPSGYERLARVDPPDHALFRIVYTGTVYAFNPVPAVFAACARLKQRRASTRAVMRIEFVGIMPDFDGATPRALARRYGLDDHFSARARCPAGEAAALQQQAAVLVAFDSVCSTALCIPSKLYHYAQMKGDLLLIGDRHGAMAQEAQKIGARVHAPTDGPAIDAVLEAAYRRWRDHAQTQRNDSRGVFDARHQSRRMHELLALIDASSGARGRRQG